MSNKKIHSGHSSKNGSYIFVSIMRIIPKIIIKQLSIVIFFIVNSTFAATDKLPKPKETIFFDIIYKGDKVGILKAERFRTNNRIVYNSSTRINTRIFLVKKINVRYKYNVTYQAGRLRSSRVHIKVNKKKPKQILVDHKGDNYVVKFSDGRRNTVSDLIDNSSIMLYFKEPGDVSQVFSEQLGNFNDVIKVREGLYKMVNEKGNENLYHYTNGKLNKIEVDGGMVSFEIKAK